MAIIQQLDAGLDSHWCSFLSVFHVPDVQDHVGKSGASVVFVVESPHIDEVRSGKRADCRYPLAGKSGKEITRKFVDKGLLCSHHAGRSLGELLQEGNLDWLRVVNVCELPLQADPYHQLFASGELDTGSESASLPSLQDWGKLMVAFRKIRKYGKTTSCKWPDDDLERAIMEDFRERLRKAVSDSPLVVALGEVAAAVCRKAANKERERTSNDLNNGSGSSPGNESWKRMCAGMTVPHPSFGHWSKEKRSAKIKKMLCGMVEHRNKSRTA